MFSEETSCNICTDVFEEPCKIAVLGCNDLHYYHDYCIKHWIDFNKKKRV